VSAAGGGEVVRDPRGRRVRELDRHGEVVATLAWAPSGRLAAAAVRLPDGRWLEIEPGAAHDPRWGPSDLLRLGAEPLTHCAAIDWSAVGAIPPLAEPARLPPGGGTAVLNLVAGLAADQRRGALTYGGPYPTEQLFLALLECFRWAREDANAIPDEPGAPTDPLAAFVAGELSWWPAPHTRAFSPEGVYVQSRERIEKLVWRGRSYYRPDWQGVERQTAHRVYEARGRVTGGLWALGEPLEEHVVLGPGGAVLAAELPAPGDEPERAVPPAVAAGLAAVIVARSAPPLAESLRAIAAGLAVEWAPLTGDLAVLAPDRIRLSARLAHALAVRARGAPTRAEQVRLGFVALAELAHALGDGLRARAQARLAAASPAAQAAALGLARAPADAAAGAREIGAAVQALLEEAAQLLA
jgi:hypothetical protein